MLLISSLNCIFSGPNTKIFFTMLLYIFNWFILNVSSMLSIYIIMYHSWIQTFHHGEQQITFVIIVLGGKQILSWGINDVRFSFFLRKNHGKCQHEHLDATLLHVLTQHVVIKWWKNSLHPAALRPIRKCYTENRTSARQSIVESLLTQRIESWHLNYHLGRWLCGHHQSGKQCSL